MPRPVLLLPLAVLLAAAGCTRGLARVENPPASAAVTTGGPWASMIYAARVDGGAIVIDLGSQQSGRALRRALARLRLADGADSVVAVFLTHSHRDHVAAWPALGKAPIFLGADEVPLLLGRRSHRGVIPRIADRLAKPDLPDPDVVYVTGFASDTAVAIGADTVRAFLVPGHTAGSAAYLFRGVLFAGDAITFTPLLGFAPAKRGFTDDREQAVASLASLRDRIAGLDVGWVCTAHAKCARADSAFWNAVLR